MEAFYSLYSASHAPLFLLFLGVFLAAYLLLAAGSYWYFYVYKKKSQSNLKIQIHVPSRQEIRRELVQSVIVLSIWSAMAVILVSLFEAGYTQLYVDIHQYGLLYFWISIGVLIISHDAYFYWTHRLMHSRVRFFYRMHNIHHESLNPTPFAVYAFGPAEAIFLGLYFYAAVFVVPLNIYVLILFFIINTAFNAAGHLGYEFFPADVHTKVVGKVFNTSTHHNMHHQYGRSNFALYFNFWDSLMKTNDPHYLETWKKLHSRER